MGKCFSKKRAYESGEATAPLKLVDDGAYYRAGFVLDRVENLDEFYDVDEVPIGEGSYGSVVRAQHRLNKVVRAVKKISKHEVKSFERFRQEISIMKLLDHPNIIKLYETYEDARNIYLIMELCVGGELFERIVEQKHMTEEACAIIMKQVLRGISYMHGMQIVHRDLKPENILLVSKISNTDIKISDFGLAKMSKDFPHRLPRSHSICGSDFYLAPEVVKQEEYGREIDIWSVGVITYVLLNGSLPFFHNVLHKLYRQIVERDLSFPEQQWSKVSKGAQDFILRLLQVRAGDRLTAEQALNHPWLRGANSPMNSFNMNSFASQNSSNQHYYGGVSPQPGDAHKNHYLQNPYSNSNGAGYSPHDRSGGPTNYYANLGA